VRILAILIAGVVLVQTTSATADRASDLAAQGEALAKEGRLTEAIAAFKQADQLRPRATHACLIALAYIRRELWPQSEVYLDACRVRSGATDPLPDWFALAHQQLVERLATADVAAVEIRVEPGALAATAAIGISSFLPDEKFAPQTVHLPRGTHTISAAVPGHDPQQQTVVIDGTTPRTVVFDFTAGKPITDPLPPPELRPPSRVVPWTLTAIGGAVLAGGVAYHVFAFKPVRDRLIDATDSTPDPALYDANEGTFDTRRKVTIALYAVGAVTLITGLVLRATVYDAPAERAPRLTYDAVRGGAIVGVEWRR
jgi:hypothetical protein